MENTSNTKEVGNICEEICRRKFGPILHNKSVMRDLMARQREAHFNPSGAI